MRFHIADEKDILDGSLTDVYFKRTKDILKAKNLDKYVVTEIKAKSLPKGYEWAILAGIEECAQLLKEVDVKVEAMAEGTMFKPWQPVMNIEGMYSKFGVYETSILGFLCQASGIATKAARCKRIAGDRIILSFGARRMHPILAPMIERNAFIGGCDGVSATKAAELIEEKPKGTIPHALILLYGDTIEATKAFDDVIDKNVMRVALIDTFLDEKFEAIRVAEAMGDKLFGMRLDTPSTRRGDFKGLLEETRWELDIRGYNNIKLLVSGGIDENSIRELKEVADGFGVGTSISNAPVIDFALDIVEIEGKPFAKRGVLSGAKNVFRCKSCYKDVILPKKETQGETKRKCDCGGEMENLLFILTESKKIVRELPPQQEIRRYVLNQLSRVEL